MVACPNHYHARSSGRSNFLYTRLSCRAFYIYDFLTPNPLGSFKRRLMKAESSRHQLRCFGLTVSTGLACIGLLSWFRGHTTVPVLFWAIATVLFLLALIFPRLLLRIEKAWMGLALVLAWVNTRIILTFLFYAILTPIGMVMRLFRDPLDRRLHDGRVSYWVQKEPKPFDPKGYENQF